MESKAARDLAERLAGTVLSQDPGAPARMLTRLAQLSGRDWLRLDECVRRPYRSPLDDVTDWPSRLGADDDGIAAVTGSMDRDGLVREAAVAVRTGGRLWALSVRAGRGGAAAARFGPGRGARLRPRAPGRRTAPPRGSAGDAHRPVRHGPRHGQVAAALDGLDDLGDPILPEAAVPFLVHPSPRVRHAAVHAVGRHSPPGDLPARLTPALRDDSGKVVGATLRYLRGYRLAPGVLEELDAAGTPRSPRASPPARSPASSAGRWLSWPGSGRSPQCEGTRGVMGSGS